MISHCVCALQIAGLNEDATGQLLVTSSINSATISLRLYKNLEIPARIRSITPSESNLNGQIRVTVTLDRFSLVYTPSDLVLRFGADPVSVESVEISTSAMTAFSFFNPPSVAGSRTVTVYPSAAPSNLATFTFLYKDRCVFDVYLCVRECTGRARSSRCICEGHPQASPFTCTVILSTSFFPVESRMQLVTTR